ncbi:MULTISPECIES: DUF6194 family protein [Micromonospora]|uniref:Erythromycin esterase n=1 Tax=Micromonospora sicca TaxID=2202420 RepID=A0A317D116_9ACTN|nr:MULTISPECIES: DUF6194 family protein [unclassified Micromonospora]MBM0224799.1 erythromycin esterase family protein [Micromonospora sp. ATA51]PWR07506.1 erythromycin esterase [Micromonospora sp. 4G51]
MASSPVPAAGWSYDLTGPGHAAAVASLLRALPAPPQLLALGEPTHGEPAFPHLRNRILEALVAHGFRSVAVESDRVAAFHVDAYVHGGDADLETVLTRGFSHGFGQLDANRELVAWMRAYNDGRPPAERLSFHGFDAPLEMTGAPSPRRHLQHVHTYLVQHLGPDTFLHGRADLDSLLGDDERWHDQAAIMDPERSVGATPEAAALRVVADDLLTTLHAHAPALTAATSRAAWHRTRVHATTALGLLRYHAQAAQKTTPAARTSRLLAVRDAWMAQHLLDIRTGEQDRGPTLVFAHNRHLQRHPSTWRLADMDLRWSSAGAIVSALLGRRYAVVVGSLGASAALNLAEPAADTFEGALGRRAALVDPAPLQRAGTLRTRTDITPEQGYFPLDEATLEHCDALLHVDATRPAPSEDDIADRILALPEVTVVRADEASGAPPSSWGDRFFFVGPDHRRPFATIVAHDTTGFDEDSQLDRPGVFRVNLDIGRQEFQHRFGYPPAQCADHHSSVDFTTLDQILPHPAYGTHGWACVLNPGVRSAAEFDRLLAYAHQRALQRHRRSLDRRHRPHG